jgi:leucyl-tRNA synthetase
VSRWLNRVWNITLEEYEPKVVESQAIKELERFTHQTIKKMTGDMDRLRLNTMIAGLMELTNYLHKVKESSNVSKEQWQKSVEALVIMIAPTAPHLAEELWHRLGHKESVHNQRWPLWDEALAKEDEITLVLQVNGKLRDRPTVPASIGEDDAKKMALASEKVQPFLQGKTVVNVIYVPGKLVNIVVK